MSRGLIFFGLGSSLVNFLIIHCCWIKLNASSFETVNVYSSQ